MDKWTKFPGELASHEISISVTGKFLHLYRTPASNQADNVPTWVLFPGGIHVDMNVLNRPEFSRNIKVYFYFENGRELYISTPQQVREYFEKRNPWETDWDLYVFDPDFHWCIAFTHEQMNGSEVILVGIL